MAKIEIFYLTHCPYCRKAKKAVLELCGENPAYGGLDIDWIEEREHPEIADARDYYSVPSVYCGGEKLYEAQPTHSYDVIKDSLRAAFDRALQG